METNFSFKRVGFILKADWIEHRKSVLINMGVFFLVWMVFLWANKSANTQYGYFWMGSFITFILYCAHAGRKLHRTKSSYLTLPAGNEEKIAALAVECLAYLALFQIIYWVGLVIWRICYSDMEIYFNHFNMLSGSPETLMFFLSLFFLSYMTFRKHAFIIVIGLSAVYLIVNIWIILLIGYGTSINHFDFSGSTVDLKTNNELLNRAVEIYNTISVPVSWIATIVIVYVSYLKLKEKELR